MLRILKYVCKYPLILLISSLSMLIVIALDNLLPYIQMILIDDGITKGKTQLVMPLLIGMLVISLLKPLLIFIKDYLYNVIGVKTHEDLKNELFQHLQSFEFSYFDQTNTGELMTRLGEDIENIWQTIGFGLRLFIENIIYFIISTVILFTLDYRLAIACLVIMIPIGSIAIILERRFGMCYGKISDQTALINTTAQENIAGVRLVKAFAREKHEILKFLKLNKTYYHLNMEQTEAVATYFPVIEFLSNISLVVMIILGGYFVLKGEMTFGTLMAFSGYIWNLIWPMRMLGWLIDILSRNSASAKKIFAILDRPSKVQSPPDCYVPDRVHGVITFKNVSFKYHEESVLNNIHLTIPRGSTVAIIGTTGSGKTSLLSLIGRYYDVCEGSVFVDDVDVTRFDLQVLRSHMSIVMQDTFLFSDTIENNVRFGKADASLDEIKEACHTACCLDFITSFEKGFSTEIGERGMGLSGGQKQRISIARALIRKAPILILDDATSALDTETEYSLLKNLKTLQNDTTTLIIAHRISAVKNADLIIFLENGEIKEQGTHTELISQKGSYYDIYVEQFKQFETLEEEAI
ncbi:MAG: transporter [Clostridia bacterium]|nr:transporter [Clostridia bacterium]